MVFLKGLKENYYRFGKIIPVLGLEVNLVEYFKNARPENVLIDELSKDPFVMLKTVTKTSNDKIDILSPHEIEVKQEVKEEPKEEIETPETPRRGRPKRG